MSFNHPLLLRANTMRQFQKGGRVERGGVEWVIPWIVIPLLHFNEDFAIVRFQQVLFRFTSFWSVP